MPRRKHKKYNRPKKLYDLALIKEENGLIKKYGLKNRKEVWRASYAIKRIRSIAKDLITQNEQIKEKSIKRLQEKGFNVSNLAEVLGLNKEDWLKRRLQSIVIQKGLAKTHKQARQMIVHKHIKINGHKIDSPSHFTTVEEEATIESTLAMPAKEIINPEEKQILNQINKKKNE